MFRHFLFIFLFLAILDLPARPASMAVKKVNADELLFNQINTSLSLLQKLDSLQQGKNYFPHCWRYVDCVDLPDCAKDDKEGKCTGHISFFPEEKGSPRSMKVMIDSGYYKYVLVYLLSYSPKNPSAKHYRSFLFEYQYLAPVYHFKFHRIVRHVAATIDSAGKEILDCDDSDDKQDFFSSRFEEAFDKAEQARIGRR